MLTMQCTGVGEQPVFTWTITRANPVIAVDYEVLGLASDGRHYF